MTCMRRAVLHIRPLRTPKENQFLRREHTDHKKTQRNETAGIGGQNRYQYAEPFQD